MRTPSMTVEQCIDALGKLPFSEHKLFVTMENRGLVRKWLTAMEMPAAYACTLSLYELSQCYNFRSVFEANMAKARDKAAGKSETRTEVNENSADCAQNDTSSQAYVVPKEDAMPDNDLAKVRDILLGGFKPGLDEQRVREIAAEEAVRAGVKIIQIEVTTPTGDVNKTEGHVHPSFELLVKAMNSRQSDGFAPNIMLVGPTGSGKTHAVHAAAKLMGRPFYTNGALTQDFQVLGFRDAHGTYHETPLRQAFGVPSVYLFDEMDSSDNSPLLALAGCLANGSQAFADAMIHRHPDCIITAAGNTWGLGATSEFVGRNRIDGAIRSRFPVRLLWGYDEQLELALSGNPDWAKRVQRARARALAGGLKVTIDPRMTIAGAALIRQGFTEQQTANMTYLADLTEAQRAIVEA